MNHRLSLTLIFIAVLTSGVACEGARRSDQREGSPPVVRERPLRVALFLDKSLSMRVARVAALELPALTPLYERLKRSGGELAIGVIGQRSNAPLVRLYVAPPPHEAQPGEIAGANVFAKASARKRADKQHAMASAAMAAWRTETARRIRVFSEEAVPILAQPTSAVATDISHAAVRANLFAEEPSTFAAPPKNVIVFVSDGIGTANRGEPLKASAADVEILVVNGVGSIGDFAPLHVTRFESVGAAIRYAASAGGSHERH